MGNRTADQQHESTNLAVVDGHADSGVGSPVGVGLAGGFGELACALVALNDSQAVLQGVVDAAVRAVPAATAVAFTVCSGGEVSSPAVSNPVAALVGHMQARTGEGPSMDICRQELTVRCDDLRRDTRWPRFAAEAVGNGVVSLLSFPLFADSEGVGTLGLYCDTAHAFNVDAERTGALLASHAAVAVSASRKVAHLHAALDSRDLIGQAKGILMERYKISGSQAFDLLVRSSQNTNTKLRDVADQLAATGELNVPSPRTRR